MGSDETLRASLLNKSKKYEKSSFDVLGICCTKEARLIEGILKPLEGVQDVSVIVPSKTVMVSHDPLKISASQIVKALNQAKLEASIRAYGKEKIVNTWPRPHIIACGVLLVVSLFKTLYHPLWWFALGAVIIGFPPIFLKSITSIRRLTLDMNILMAIAVVGAVALGDYSEAGFIVFLFSTADWLETLARYKAASGMTSLMSMAPQKAVLAETGEVVDAQKVMFDSLIAVLAGEIIPIDGVVVEGRSEVDERTLTGESFPVLKQPGSQVWAGTLNIDGYLCVRTTAMAENSAVARMGRLVEEAQSSRSHTQRLIDTCVKYYTPVVVVVSATVAILPLIMKMHNPKQGFRLALVLIVSACPCALVLSTPIAYFCALLKAAQMGLLVKGGDVLEALSQVKAAAFDKTGTITRGEFTVREFHVLNSDIPLQTLLYWVSSIESKSSHPMASALVEYARSNSVEPKPDDVPEFLIFPGEGVYGQIDGKDIFVGNKRIIQRALSQEVPSMERMEGVTAGYVVFGRELVGAFTLSDSCRTGSQEAISELKSLGIKSAMLTGDSTTAANFAQNQLNGALEEIHAELLPADKVRVIKDLKSRVGPTMMIGDGMNDAPALATADVGISMGISGSAVATETSHITLMSNDLQKIPQAVRLARRTHHTILVNIILSIVTKTAVLGPAFAGYPLLWAAVLADVGTCLIVILHSMMLLRENNVKAEKNGLAESNRPDKSCAKQNCCDLEASVKQCQSNCCRAKEERSKQDQVDMTSCGDDSAAKQKPNSCQSHCCVMPTTEKGNTSNEKSHSDNQKEETKGKGNSCQGECCGTSYQEEVQRREDCGNGCCKNLDEFPKIITE
ncbi:putative inactive cadmium/zinc-transporting ATPase HMA3 [Carex littledalei]|uniref:Putative inactive cadmium/zinc-transporting ATPase HMA3 n=1 Tax=Carex littledalei TaxID=544730 RepID=A0A833VZR2_9POAL|nr:putative inactive cadmium/zinc-transporting ATPase HMA3 [Carex littledalei]